MHILVFGGTGFVGLNIAATLLARGHAATLFDRAGLPSAAGQAFAESADRLTVVRGDITDRRGVEDVIAAGCDAIILGAAITAGPERDATDPETILQVNLLAQMPIWKKSYQGVEELKVAVMGCVVNGPGESKHSNIGISLPGTGEEPKAPVFVDGRLTTTLRGATLVGDFISILNDYVASHYAPRPALEGSSHD